MSTGEQQEQHDPAAVDLTARVSGFIVQYVKQIAFGIVALVILLAVIASISNTGRTAAEESWSRFASAQGAGDFANVASDFPGTEIAVWARLTEGEMLLSEAVQLQFSDRAAATGQFKKAGEALDSVLSSSNLPAEARERALLGKARQLEATSDGNMDEAIAAYEKVKGIPNSIYAELVDSRIEALKKDDTKAFYAWFAKQSPKPEDRATPRDGLPTGHPELPVTLPPIPEELFPANWSELTVKDEPAFEEPGATDENTTTKPVDDTAVKEPAPKESAPVEPAPKDSKDDTASPADGPAAKGAPGDDAATSSESSKPE
ncbi:MAG: hypothetical protein O3B13_04385 [Planctomycetota bacterium]|nr:hypothetical protein [Planctomycetota bacterium]